MAKRLGNLGETHFQIFDRAAQKVAEVRAKTCKVMYQYPTQNYSS